MAKPKTKPAIEAVVLSELQWRWAMYCWIDELNTQWTEQAVGDADRMRLLEVAQTAFLASPRDVDSMEANAIAFGLEDIFEEIVLQAMKMKERKIYANLPAELQLKEKE